MNKWTELRTAYKLAKHRTLSATADDIGVHRSTVMRHIDVLEEALGVVLFQRNDKGYIPTEAGLEIMKLGTVTENQFSQLEARLLNFEEELSGTIRLTAINDMAYFIMPYVQKYLAKYPKMKVDYIGAIRNFDLEYGEADIAIRTGDKPTTPDNIVIPIYNVEIVLCAHKSYLEKVRSGTTEELQQHKFIAMKQRFSQLPWIDWIHKNIPKEQIIFHSPSLQVIEPAIEAGMGIAAIPKKLVERNPNLCVISDEFSWDFPMWCLVHRDMYRLGKIRAFVEVIKEGGS